MKLSTKGRYGLRALVDLSSYQGSEIVSISNIAERQEISESYLAQLFSKLKRAGILESVRGATGGYRLAHNSSEITVGDVLRVLEGNMEPIECLGLGEDACCGSKDYCTTRIIWDKINRAVNEAIDSMTLEEFANESIRCRSRAVEDEHIFTRPCQN